MQKNKVTLRRYTPKKLGYEKINETNQYRIDSNKKELSELYFSFISEISIFEELIKFLKDFRKN